MTTQPTFRRIDPVSGDAVSAVRLRESIWRPLTVAGSVLAFLLLLASIGPAAALDKKISIELNRLEDVSGNCRLSFVLTNGLAAPVDALTIETVLFDPEGRVDRFLLLKARPLPVGKMRVQQFDVGQAACASIGRVLLNDVTDCAGGDLAPATCLAAIDTTSRSDVPFVSTVNAADAPPASGRVSENGAGSADPAASNPVPRTPAVSSTTGG